jgi:hypothetical protein
MFYPRGASLTICPRRKPLPAKKVFRAGCELHPKHLAGEVMRMPKAASHPQGGHEHGQVNPVKVPRFWPRRQTWSKMASALPRRVDPRGRYQTDMRSFKSALPRFLRRPPGTQKFPRNIKIGKMIGKLGNLLMFLAVVWLRQRPACLASWQVRLGILLQPSTYELAIGGTHVGIGKFISSLPRGRNGNELVATIKAGSQGRSDRKALRNGKGGGPEFIPRREHFAKIFAATPRP